MIGAGAWLPTLGIVHGILLGMVQAGDGIGVGIVLGTVHGTTLGMVQAGRGAIHGTTHGMAQVGRGITLGMIHGITHQVTIGDATTIQAMVVVRVVAPMVVAQTCAVVAAQAITHHTTDHHWAHAVPLPIIITVVALIDMAQQMCRADVQVMLQVVEVWAILVQTPPTLVVHHRR